MLVIKNAVVTNTNAHCCYMHGSPVLFDDVTINRFGSISRIILRVDVRAANHVTFSSVGALHLLSNHGMFSCNNLFASYWDPEPSYGAN